MNHTTVVSTSSGEGVVIIGARKFLLPVALGAALALAGCTSGAGAATGSAVAGTSEMSDPTATPVAGENDPAPTADGEAATPGQEPPAEPVLTERVVQLAPGIADEASGIASSRGNPGAYFLVDDSQDHIVALASDGSVLAIVGIEGMSETNAEAISSGTCGSIPLPDGASSDTCLYIGDIGDNSSRRRDIVVYRIAEPDLAVPPTDPVTADEWRYTYPEGAQDAESMMVGTDGSIVIVTKPEAGRSPTRIYRGEAGGGDLALIREFTPPEPAMALKTFFTGNVAVDVSAEPGRVLLLTYDELSEYIAPDPNADLTTFPDWPHRRLLMPSLPQAEGVTGDVDGCGYVLASEAGPGGDNGSLGFVTCG